MIRFPGLGLEFSISRVALEWNGVEIYWYAIFIVVSILIFLLFYPRQAKKLDLKREDILDLSIILIPTAILGARIYYVLFELDFYLQDPIQIFNLKKGGLAIYGGIISGAIVLFFFCKKRKISVLDVMDLVVPFLALGQSIGRWGNFFNGEAYGIETTLPWRMELIQEGRVVSVHPTFLYESLATFAIFLFLLYLTNRRKYKGQISCWYLILYAFVRFWIEGIRNDSLWFFSVRISQVLSLFIFVVFSCIIAKQRKKTLKSKINAKNG